MPEVFEMKHQPWEQHSPSPLHLEVLPFLAFLSAGRTVNTVTLTAQEVSTGQDWA